MLTALLIWSTTKGATIWCGLYIVTLIIDGTLILKGLDVLSKLLHKIKNKRS